MSKKDTKDKEVQPDYEDRDIRLRPLVIFFAVTAVFTVLSLIGVAILFRGLVKSVEKQNQPWSEFAQERQLPAAPLLQVSAPMDLAGHLAKEEALLENYEWLDKNGGAVRIPIERAMTLLAERGLPVAGEEEPTEPTAKPKEEPAPPEAAAHEPEPVPELVEPEPPVVEHHE